MAQPNISLDNLGVKSAPGDLRKVHLHGHVVTIETDDAVAELAAFAEGVVRVCWHPRKVWENDPVGYLATDHLRRVHWRKCRGATAYSAGDLRVDLAGGPMRLAFRQGERELFAEDPDQPMGYLGSSVAATWIVDRDERLYGLGQSPGVRHERRGQVRRMAAMHRGGAGGDLPIPLLISGAGHGLLVDNPNLAEFDLRRRGRISFSANDGYLVYYVLTGPTPADVLRQYALLTGPAPLPPRWAFGPMFSRIPGGRQAGYRSAKELLALADRLRRRRIPADGLILDYQWDERIGAFHWDRKRFPKPAAMIRALRERGFSTIVQLKPAVNLTARTASGLRRGGHLLRRHDGSVHTSNYHLGRSGYLDFFQAETRAWYQARIARLLDAGVAGWWTDEGEWLGFERHCARDLARSADGMRNRYNNAWCAALAAAHRAASKTRCLNITRGGGAGIQQHGIALWSGDVNATWEGLREQVTLALQSAMSGIPFWNSDGGGFLGAPTSEIYIRWAQFAVFCSLTRFHGVGPREPWCFGAQAEAVVREALEWRMRLLPYIYTAARQAHDRGIPMMRPALLAAPEDERFADADGVYFFGDALLIHPVTRPIQELRRSDGKLETPVAPGRWYEFWTGRSHDVSAPQRFLSVPAPIAQIPVLVRGPALVVLADPAPCTREQSWESLTLRVYAGAEGEAWQAETELYEDDGETRGYERGASRRTRIVAQSDGAGPITVRIDRAVGRYPGSPARRRWRIEVYGTSARPTGAPTRPIGEVNGKRVEVTAGTHCWTLAGAAQPVARSCTMRLHPVG